MAGTLVDIGNITLPSVSGAPNVSVAGVAGVGATPASGVIVGQNVDLLHANNFCNLTVMGGPSLSGQFRVLVQNSDSTASGTFTDPTSGLAVMPTRFLSGGVLVCNSGNAEMRSGGLVFAGFVRTGRYARTIIMSGDQFNAPVMTAFTSQLKTPGSGGGFSYSPTSGVVSV